MMRVLIVKPNLIREPQNPLALSPTTFAACRKRTSCRKKWTNRQEQTYPTDAQVTLSLSLSTVYSLATGSCGVEAIQLLLNLRNLVCFRSWFFFGRKSSIIFTSRNIPEFYSSRGGNLFCKKWPQLIHFLTSSQSASTIVNITTPPTCLYY